MGLKMFSSGRDSAPWGKRMQSTPRPAIVTRWFNICFEAASGRAPGCRNLPSGASSGCCCWRLQESTFRGQIADLATVLLLSSVHLGSSGYRMGGALKQYTRPENYCHTATPPRVDRAVAGTCRPYLRDPPAETFLPCCQIGGSGNGGKECKSRSVGPCALRTQGYS